MLKNTSRGSEYSYLIGEREVMREQVTTNRTGAVFPLERSTSTSLQHITESAVLHRARSKQLPDLHGYLKLASQPEWRRVKNRCTSHSQCQYAFTTQDSSGRSSP